MIGCRECLAQAIGSCVGVLALLLEHRHQIQRIFQSSELNSKDTRKKRVPQCGAQEANGRQEREGGPDLRIDN